MKIVADTHIWYYMGDDEDLFKRVKSCHIAPTYINIFELSKSENLIDKEEYSRAAIRKLFAFRQNAMLEPPFIYLAKMHNNFHYDAGKEVGHWLEFTEKFAQGESIELDKRAFFRQRVAEIRTDLITGSDFLNTEAERIRQKNIDKKQHKKIDTIDITARFINFCVEATTEKKYNIYGMDIKNIELLIKTLDHFFKTLETSKMKFQPNDWFDFAILAYVQPGDKFWTKEKRWINLIKDAGCSEYLFED